MNSEELYVQYAEQSFSDDISNHADTGHGDTHMDGYSDVAPDEGHVDIHSDDSW